MPFSPAFSPVFMAVFRAINSGSFRDDPWALRFNGVNSFGRFFFKPIYIDGDRLVAFKTGSDFVLGRSSTILSHTAGNSLGNREFLLVFNTNNVLTNIAGGVSADSVTPIAQPSSTYHIEHIGNNLLISRDGSSVASRSLVKANIRNNFTTIPTTIGCTMTDLNGGTPSSFYAGVLKDLWINDTFWPISDRNQRIQLPVPSGLGAEALRHPLQTHAPSAGVTPSANSIHFESIAAWHGINVIARAPFLAGAPYLIEFDLALRSGRLWVRTAIGGTHGAGIEFTSGGRQRAILIANAGNAGLQFFGMDAGSTFTVSNITLRPLYEVAPNSELIRNAGFDSSVVPWGGNNLSAPRAVGGVLEFDTIPGQNPQSRVEQALNLVRGAWYLVTGDFISSTNNTFAEIGIIRNSTGGFASIMSQRLTSPGRFNFVFRAMESDAIISLRGTNNPTIAGTVRMDNISVTRLSTICNPIILENVTPEHWVQVPKSSRSSITHNLFVDAATNSYFTLDGAFVGYTDIT